jgi:hypothetical protein
MARDKEPFLSRWSRRKLEEARAPDPAPPAEPSTPAESAPPELPPVDQLGFESDYRGFLHPKVDEALRRQALKKLFSAAHFQTPDMMDDFNEDYTLLESLAPEAASKLAHAKRTLFGGEPEAPPGGEAPREGEGKAPPEGEVQEAKTEVARTDAPAPEPRGGGDGASG